MTKCSNLLAHIFILPVNSNASNKQRQTKPHNINLLTEWANIYFHLTIFISSHLGHVDDYLSFTKWREKNQQQKTIVVKNARQQKKTHQKSIRLTENKLSFSIWYNTRQGQQQLPISLSASCWTTYPEQVSETVLFLFIEKRSSVVVWVLLSPFSSFNTSMHKARNNIYTPRERCTNKTCTYVRARMCIHAKRMNQLMGGFLRTASVESNTC